MIQMIIKKPHRDNNHYLITKASIGFKWFWLGVQYGWYMEFGHLSGE